MQLGGLCLGFRNLDGAFVAAVGIGADLLGRGAVAGVEQEVPRLPGTVEHTVHLADNLGVLAVIGLLHGLLDTVVGKLDVVLGSGFLQVEHVKSFKAVHRLDILYPGPHGSRLPALRVF